MSSLHVTHPEDGLLLRYIDGELPARKSRHVQKHLEACWECRTEVDHLHETVADCVRYRKTVLAAHLPPPPDAWADLYRGFDRIDALAARPVFRPILSRFRWVLAAAAVAVAIFGVYSQLHETPSVQAAALLRRAAAAADANPAKVIHLRIRTKSRQINRLEGKVESSTSRAADAAAIQRLFLSAHYDWDNPLSARSFQTWRGGLANKQDEVAKTQDGYRIRTSTAQGALSSASITLREADLRPTEGRLDFRDREWVEFSQIPEPAAPESGFTAASKAEARERPSVPSRTAAVTPAPSASISDELQVLAALHQIGADLGDPVEVSLSQGRVLVSGIGVPTSRQQLIHSKLDAMPNVAVEFAEPDAAILPPNSVQPPPTAATPANSRLQDRLETELGGRAQLEKFSSQVLDWNDAAMSRAYALRRLAQSFPAGSESAMAARDRSLLRNLAREHVETLAGLLGNMQAVLTPALAALGGSARVQAPDSASPAQAAAWQPAAERLFQAARRVEKLLSLLSGVTPGESATGLPSDLLSALNEERADLDQCNRLLGGS